MRVYHFLSAEHGLDDLWKRRLKVSTFDKINDPFELNALKFGTSEDRRDFRRLQKHITKSKGIICFSKKWESSLQWSHYADRHKGLCLGFDIDSSIVLDVQYTPERAMVNGFFNKTEAEKVKLVHQVLATKFDRWAYEEEVRVFIELKDAMIEQELYFCDFGDGLQLRDVLIGPRSKIRRLEISQALGNLVGQVKITNTRLAFKSFNVVEQKRRSLQK
jgi:hypothetical protein